MMKREEERIFAAVCELLPLLHPRARLASGGLFDCRGRGTSDVDVSVWTAEEDPVGACQLLSHLPGFAIDSSKPSRHIAAFTFHYEGIDRCVNVYFTAQRDLADRAVTHRANELRINADCPHILTVAIAMRLAGHGTEKAYALALGVDDCDPYDLMLGPYDTVLKPLALRREQELSDIHKRLSH